LRGGMLIGSSNPDCITSPSPLVDEF